MNSFGKIFTVTTFGESHGKAIGGIIDGVPSNFAIDKERIQAQLDRRKPGQSDIVTQRRESDSVQFLSGIFEGQTTGTPIGFLIPNEDHHSADYEQLRHTFRPGHADYTFQKKFGIRDYRGGGRSSARETAARVVAGALAMQILEKLGVRIYAYTSSVGDISVPEDFNLCSKDISSIDSNIVRCPHEETAIKMLELIHKIKDEGDTVGGIVTGVIEGLPQGLGEPIFDKFQAVLAHAMLSINAVKGFEYGMGFKGSTKTGSQVIDHFKVKNENTLGTHTNFSGGIQGGITNGEPVYFRVAFKPVATLLREIDTYDDKMQPVVLKMKGRHDPCVVPRAVPVVESMAAICALDAYLLDNARRITL